MPSAVSSAGGLLTLLEEDNDDIKQYALSKLDGVVNDYFFEISPSIASIEALYEDETFKDRELAALVASKVRAARVARVCVAARAARRGAQGRQHMTMCVSCVDEKAELHSPNHAIPFHPHTRLEQVFYHLGELDSALTYALGAGSRFDVTDDSEFVRTLVGKPLLLVFLS